MKPQVIIFKRPVKVLQIFRNINVYDKTKKSFVDRKAELIWNDIKSINGHIFENELYLPEKILTNPDLKTCDLITITDDNPHQSSKKINSKNDENYNYCLHLNRPVKVDIFKIERQDDVLELHLNYGYFEIGIPIRDNFKICEIKKNNPVEIKINGKTDHSMSSGRERIYKEQHYIIEYVGDFNHCKILREPYSYVTKYIPTEIKDIDLIKQLW